MRFGLVGLGRMGLSRFAEDTGEVKWLLTWGLDADLPTPVTSAAQTSLMGYRDESSVQAKVHALLRHEFGGHPVHVTDERADRQSR